MDLNWWLPACAGAEAKASSQQLRCFDPLDPDRDALVGLDTLDLLNWHCAVNLTHSSHCGTHSVDHVSPAGCTGAATCLCLCVLHAV
jgi:hypothetical protein